MIKIRSKPGRSPDQRKKHRQMKRQIACDENLRSRHKPESDSRTTFCLFALRRI